MLSVKLNNEEELIVFRKHINGYSIAHIAEITNKSRDTIERILKKLYKKAHKLTSDTKK